MVFKVGFDYSTRNYGFRKCSICDTEYKKTNHHSKYCSSKCKSIGSLKYQANRRRTNIYGNLQTITAGCRLRAKRRGMDCDIDSEFICKLYDMQEGLCAMTKEKLLPSSSNTRKYTHPHTISIDRIDNEKGYTRDNVHLVTTIYNTAKNSWTQEDVLTMAKSLVKWST